jgi:long-chain acyl-CoA synthetase
VTIGERENLTDPVWSNAADHPDAVQFSLRTGSGWRDITCRQFRDEVIGLARGLVAAGVAPGERVALMSKTRYEWTLIDYAIWSAGAVTVPIYETSSPEQIQWILSDSSAAACFVETDRHRGEVEGVRSALPQLRQVWQIEPASGPDAVAELTTAGLASPAEEVQRRRDAVGAEDPATIIYTSGTTGRPKGCLLTHRNIYSDIANAVPGLSDIFHSGSSTLLFLPLAHSFARIIQAGVVQVRVRTTHSPSVANLVEDLKAFQPTFVLAVPRVFEKVFNGAQQRAEADGKRAIFARAERVAIAYSEALDSKRGPGLGLRAQHALFDRLVYRKLRAALGGRCTTAISGGAPLGARLAHFFRGIGVTIYEGYGLTETSPAIAVNVTDHIRLGSVGRPLPGVTVRIADDGEILVRGDIVFPGYWNNPQATAETIDDEGWFHTGDLGGLDDDGYLSITGRKKEIIVTGGGKNVAPAVLENRIRAHALVSQVIVVGDRQPFIAALVTIDEDAFPQWKAQHAKPSDATVADLRTDPDLLAAIQGVIDEANRAVSRAESIRAFRILASDFTEANGMLTPSLKVKRTVVAKEHADEIAAIYR